MATEFRTIDSTTTTRPGLIRREPGKHAGHEAWTIHTGPKPLSVNEKLTLGISDAPSVAHPSTTEQTARHAADVIYIASQFAPQLVESSAAETVAMARTIAAAWKDQTIAGGLAHIHEKRQRKIQIRSSRQQAPVGEFDAFVNTRLTEAVSESVAPAQTESATARLIQKTRNLEHDVVNFVTRKTRDTLTGIGQKLSMPWSSPRMRRPARPAFA